MALKRILLVEDDADVRTLLGHTLLSGGYNVDVADTTLQAFSLIEINSYDLVVTDGMLPDGTGIAVADKAKSRGIKVLIITGDALRFSKAELEGHQYVLKPLRPSELLRVVAKHLEPAPRKEPHLFTVLFVEDDRAVRHVVVQVLAEKGFAVLSAPDADTALRILADRPADLLFADIVMPGMDGVELARRARVLRPGIKVLFATGYPASASERVATDYGRLLFKPLRQAEWLGEVEASLNG